MSFDIDWIEHRNGTDPEYHLWIDDRHRGMLRTGYTMTLEPRWCFYSSTNARQYSELLMAFPYGTSLEDAKKAAEMLVLFGDH